MSQISLLKRITTKSQQNCEKFNQIVLKKDLKQIFIGRDIDCNYRISSIEISRKHALLEHTLSDNFWTITDLNSTNGLYVNSVQLSAQSPQRLSDGDKVSFGPPLQSQFWYQFIDNITVDNDNNTTDSCVSYELSSINLTTIPVIPIVTRIQTSSASNSLLSSSVRFDIEPNQSRTISLTTSMPTRSGLSYSAATARGSSVSVTTTSSSAYRQSSVHKKVMSRKASVDTREAQPMADFVEHDYSRSSSNRITDKNNKNKKMSSLKLKDNTTATSKSAKITETERKLIAKEREKLEKSKKSLEQQKTMDRLKIKRKEEALQKKQKELERKEREAKKREDEIEKIRKDLMKEKKRLADKKQELTKESEELVRQSGKRKLRSSSTRDSLDSKRQCSEDTKQKTIEEIFESELTCSVCSEYFIQAVNLNCSHTFCLSCIEEWKHSKSGTHVCPICREKIENQNRELILDNLIDQFVAKMKPNLKEHRKSLEEERKKRLESKISANQRQTARMGTTQSRGNRLTRLIPSLHFFMRSINSDSDSDSADVNFIGLNFGDSSVNSNSSAESDSDSDDSSDDSSDSSSDGDQSIVVSESHSARSRSPTPDSQSDVESVSSASADSLPSNRDDYNGFSDSDSDVVSIISLHSNDSDSDSESRVSIPLSAFADYQSLDEIGDDSDSDSDSISFND